MSPEQLSEFQGMLSDPVMLFIGAAAVSLIGIAIAAYTFEPSTGQTIFSSRDEDEGPPTVSNAVLVFGATGRTGKLLVKALAESGRDVVAAVRGDAEAGAEKLGELGLVPDKRGQGGMGTVVVRGGANVAEARCLTAELFEGVTQVAIATGSIFGEDEQGVKGYVDGMTPEVVHFKGNENIAQAAAKFLPAEDSVSAETKIRLLATKDVAKWEKQDDTIMGGTSTSAMDIGSDFEGAKWAGNLVAEGGGFCGIRTLLNPGIDFRSFDGIAIRVRSPEAGRFKMNLKARSMMETPEVTYQASFDVPGGNIWTDVQLFWREFVPVRKTMTDTKLPPLGPDALKDVASIALVYSRFSFNKAANPYCWPGPFQLDIAASGIQGFRSPRTQVVLLSSAAVERNARVGDDAEARDKEIPIVKLNPGGVLNWKYKGENAVRRSGLRYAVVRSTGMLRDDEQEGGPFLIEARQGDEISGAISRPELAQVLMSALTPGMGTDAAAFKTIEVRRQEAKSDAGKAMTDGLFERMWLLAVGDSVRPRFGLPLMPAESEPPAAPSEEKKKEVLADEMVRNSIRKGRGAATRVVSSLDASVDEDADVAALTQPPARAWIAAWQAKQEGGESEGYDMKAAVADAEAGGSAVPVGGSAAEAREWIEQWRASQNVETARSST
ncbi:unnamed protein product [Pedinophyceae sp. YPF-701]|nr:unnamed protein product [Pedinophyceae sp. YPF-701]